MRFAVLFVWGALLVSRSARSEDANAEAKFERIQELLHKADFDGAEHEAQELLETGDVSRALVVRTVVALGIVAAARGDQASAQRAFVRALRLEPATSLPSSAGPHVVELFARAGAQVAREPRLQLRAELYRGVSQVDVRLSINGPHDGLAHSVIVTGPNFRRTLAVGGRSTLMETIVLPPGGCVELAAGVSDEYGNVLWPALARAEPCSSAASPVATQAPPTNRRQPASDGDIAHPGKSSRPIPNYVWVGAGLTVGLATATTVYGIKALDAQAEYQASLEDSTQSYESKRLLRSKAIDARLAPTLLGVATAAFGATTVVLFLTRPRARSVALAPAVLHGGMLVDLRSEF